MWEVVFLAVIMLVQDALEHTKVNPDLGGGLQLHQVGEELCLSANGPWDATVVEPRRIATELAFDLVTQQSLVVE